MNFGGSASMGGSVGVGGAANGATGGKATGSPTGGKASTGGANASGGGTGFDPNTYCNGILSGQPCGQTQVQADLRTVNMLLVLDESGSMNDKASTSDAQNKWGIMKTALANALTPVQNDINFGLLLFPYEPNGVVDTTNIITSCNVPNDAAAISVPIAAGPNNLAAILGVVGRQTPAGSTPTGKALQQAYNYFATGDGKNLPGTKWVLLATDGGPNCNPALTCAYPTCTQNLDLQCADKQPTTTFNCCDPAATGQPNANMICLDDLAATSQIANLALIGVKTFVVGLPGSEPYANALNNFAIAGKVPNTGGAANEQYYAVSAASAPLDLTKAFANITTQLAKTCDLVLSWTPADRAKVSVAIDCAVQPSVPTGSAPDAGVDGYYIDYSLTPAHLKLVGAPCNRIMTQGANHVDVIIGCIPIQ